MLLRRRLDFIRINQVTKGWWPLRYFILCSMKQFKMSYAKFSSFYIYMYCKYMHSRCIYIYKTVSNISFSESPFRIQLKKQITKSIIHAHMKLGRKSNSISDLICPKTPAHLSSLLTTVKRRFFTLRSFTANLNIIVLSEWNYYK